MASKSASAGTGRATAERLASSTMRTIADIAMAVGEGFRARNEYRELVGNGTDPVKAAAEAMRHASLH